MLIHKNLFSAVSDDPATLGMSIAALAREVPIYFDDGLGMPVVIRSEQINAILKDPETYSTRVFQNGLMKDALVAAQGEAHTRMRKLYNGFFAPQKIKAYEERIVAPTVREVIDRLAEHAQVDLLDHLCMEVPQRVVSTLFGLSVDRIQENDALVRAVLHAIVRPYDQEAVAAGNAAYQAMADELNAISTRELAKPSETLLGEIAKTLLAEGQGTVEACERIVFTLILGSYETTIWGIASTLAAMLREPEVTRRLRDDPALVPGAIEESWRWCGSSIGTVRYIEREVTIGDHVLEPGAVVHLGWLGMHFDAELYDHPERFDVERKAKTMIFGGGPHFCVGAALARMETRVTINQLLARYPNLRADPERPAPAFHVGARGSIMFGPDRLPALLD